MQPSTRLNANASPFLALGRMNRGQDRVILVEPRRASAAARTVVVLGGEETGRDYYLDVA
jgi:hypothetical protein